MLCSCGHNVVTVSKGIGMNLSWDGANYVPNVHYIVYENWEEFLEKNPGGKKYYLSRYGKKTPHQLELSNPDETYYFVIGKESSGIPYEILQENLDKCIIIIDSTDSASIA